MKLIKLTSIIYALLSSADTGFCNIVRTRSLHECGSSVFSSGFPHADPLSTYETGMVKYLAICMNDIYLRYGDYAREQCDLSRPIEIQDGKKLRVEECGAEGGLNNTFEADFEADYLSWGLYRLLEEDGTETETTILAFMGTDSFGDGELDEEIELSQLAQDFSIIFAGTSIQAVAQKAVQKYWELNPTYITGHSLGGTIAEMVCDQTGAYGASFGAPGPWGHEWNLLTEEKYDGAKFSVIMNVNDEVGGFPLLNSASGYEFSHVACSDQVLSIDFPASSNTTYGHSSTSYLENIWTHNPNW